MICKICNQEIKTNEYLVKCSKCNNVYHTKCWVKNKGCENETCNSLPTQQFTCATQDDIDKLYSLQASSSSFNPRNIRIDRCAICNKIILNGENTTTCEYCNSIYHTNCWQANGGCFLKCGDKKRVTSSVLTSENTNKVCPYCRTNILPSEHETICPKCKIPHHTDCWNENGGCTTYGCDGKTNSVAPPPVLATTFTPKICPYCMTEISEFDDYITCSKCEIPHHRDCWNDNGGCTTYGCSSIEGYGKNDRAPITARNNNYYPNNYNNRPPNNQPIYYTPPPQSGCNSVTNCCSGCIIIVILIILFFIFFGSF